MQTIELSPNCSLTPRAARIFFVSVALVSLTIAGLLAAGGFWPVLAFASTELALLGAAITVCMHRSRRREVIYIRDDRVVVERHAGHGSDKLEFSRYWVRVILSEAPWAGHPSRLLLRSHGRQCEIGRFLTEDARRALKRRLEAGLAVRGV